MPYQSWDEFVKAKAVKRGLSMRAISVLLAYVERLHSRGLPVIFDFEHLSRLVGIRKGKMASMIYKPDRFYREFRIPKRSGEMREIAAPTLILKECQRWILRNILERITVSNEAHGFIAHRSILSNAAAHVRKQLVLNLDLKDFFPSIRWRAVFDFFRSLGYSRKVCFYLTSLTTFREALPQGAPTSPLLSNLIARHLDSRLAGLAKNLDVDYTRYADDMTFSGGAEVLSALPTIKKILKEEGFALNDSKVRIMRSHTRQEVTGLVVNKLPAVRRGRVRWLRQQLYYIRKYGLQDHKEHTRSPHMNTREFLYGHALFVRMVSPTKGAGLLAQLNAIDW